MGKYVDILPRHDDVGAEALQMDQVVNGVLERLDDDCGLLALFDVYVDMHEPERSEELKRMVDEWMSRPKCPLCGGRTVKATGQFICSSVWCLGVVPFADEG